MTDLETIPEPAPAAPARRKPGVPAGTMRPGTAIASMMRVLWDRASDHAHPANPYCTSAEIAAAVGATVRIVSANLAQLRRRGLVSRVWSDTPGEQGKTAWYALTGQGAVACDRLFRA
jgi:hypothetical protein